MSSWTRRVQMHELMMSDPELADVYLAEKKMAGIRRYMLRGRRFAALPDDVLATQWVHSYRCLVWASESEFRWAEVMDRQHEFDLRHLEPPRHLVKSEIARFNEDCDRLLRESKPDPDAWEEAWATMKALRALLQRPKH